jgi:DNA-directed RNA polymerase specialized sigma24 family protein
MKMDESDRQSVTYWFKGLADGDVEAPQRLWERYFDRLVKLARARLRRSGIAGTTEDEEDAALSAFNVFCQAAAQRRYPGLHDRNNLWRILVVITERKVLDQLDRRSAQKRGGGRVTLGPPADGLEDPLASVAGPDPTPEFAAMLAEELKLRLDSLNDPLLRRVAELRLEGYTIAEIGAKIGRASRTVDVYFENIRSIWGEKTPDDE